MSLWISLRFKVFTFSFLPSNTFSFWIQMLSYLGWIWLLGIIKRNLYVRCVQSTSYSQLRHTGTSSKADWHLWVMGKAKEGAQSTDMRESWPWSIQDKEMLGPIYCQSPAHNLPSLAANSNFYILESQTEAEMKQSKYHKTGYFCNISICEMQTNMNFCIENTVLQKWFPKATLQLWKFKRVPAELWDLY